MGNRQVGRKNGNRSRTDSPRTVAIPDAMRKSFVDRSCAEPSADVPPPCSRQVAQKIPPDDWTTNSSISVAGDAVVNCPAEILCREKSPQIFSAFDREQAANPGCPRRASQWGQNLHNSLRFGSTREGSTAAETTRHSAAGGASWAACGPGVSTAGVSAAGTDSVASAGLLGTGRPAGGSAPPRR